MTITVRVWTVLLCSLFAAPEVDALQEKQDEKILEKLEKIERELQKARREIKEARVVPETKASDAGAAAGMWKVYSSLWAFTYEAKTDIEILTNQTGVNLTIPFKMTQEVSTAFALLNVEFAYPIELSRTERISVFGSLGVGGWMTSMEMDLPGVTFGSGGGTIGADLQHLLGLDMDFDASFSLAASIGARYHAGDFFGGVTVQFLYGFEAEWNGLNIDQQDARDARFEVKWFAIPVRLEAGWQVSRGFAFYGGARITFAKGTLSLEGLPGDAISQFQTEIAPIPAELDFTLERLFGAFVGARFQIGFVESELEIHFLDVDLGFSFSAGVRF